MNTPRASVIVPTHDHADLLDIAINSALTQDIRDIEVIVIGDGVGDDTRAVIGTIDDARLRFLDLEKGEHHGEAHRHEAIKLAESPVICYLCDDDIMLPDHVSTMLQMLEEVDLAQSLNGYLTEHGNFEPYVADLSLADYRRVMLEPPSRNGVSLTGTAHSVSAYLRLDHGWRVPPPGVWPDLHMWRQFLSASWVTARTSGRVSVLQFPSETDGRADWSPQRRRGELELWASRANQPGFRESFDGLVRAGLVRNATEWLVKAYSAQDSYESAIRERDANYLELLRTKNEWEKAVKERDALVRELRMQKAEWARAVEQRDGLLHELRMQKVEWSRAVRERDSLLEEVSDLGALLAEQGGQHLGAP